MNKLTLKEKDEVTVNLQSLYESGKAITTYGKIECVGNDEYYDLYNTDGDLVCLDGETCYVKRVSDNDITLLNDNGEVNVLFRLTWQEAEIALNKN